MTLDQIWFVSLVGLINRYLIPTTIALSSSLSHLFRIALIYRNLDQSLFSGSTLTAFPNTVLPTEHRARFPQRERERIPSLLTVSYRVLSYIATGRSSGSTPAVVDELGCGLGCATIRGMVVAGDDAICMRTPEGRGACLLRHRMFAQPTARGCYCQICSLPFFHQGLKISVTSFKNYLMLASQLSSPPERRQQPYGIMSLAL